MEKQMVIVANDLVDTGSKQTAELQARFPEMEFLFCASSDAVREALGKHGKRVAMLVTDDCVPKPEAGRKLALSLRTGEFGKELQHIPILVVTGDPRPVKTSPPIFYMTRKEGFEHGGVERAVKGYLKGEDWKVVLKLFEEQDARNSAAE
ncbi:MAG: hypothetical protein K2Q01_12235, partial [Rickettsiales bacterium]|nr:hypothetical protein [Rickettsiales bacterium]